MGDNNRNEAIWRTALLKGDPRRRWGRHIFFLLPSDPRCKMCMSPFAGMGGALVKTLLNRRPSNYNPQICTQCDHYIRKYPGGAEVELTMMFADVRGSTSIAEGMSPLEFSQLMHRFYTAATQAVMKTDGLIEKFIGDGVTVLFAPGTTGGPHAPNAIEAARLLLQATGHGEPGGPWLPVGAGVHTGVAFVGSLDSGGVLQLTALGDAPNAAARLASSAAAGEILVSESAAQAAGLDTSELERREMALKGRSDPLTVYVLRVQPEPQADPS